MCGISAIVAPTKTSDDDAAASPQERDLRTKLHEQMQASLNNIKHRGPDSTGIWISSDQRIVLGHNRLAINDLSDGGNQPWHAHDGKVHAIVNGELYDYEKIKERLAAENGYHFTSNSDSEIVLALYQVYGLEFLQHLRGEFAICLYDESKNLFVAARDRYGIKPLFYTKQSGRLLVAAEIKAFLPLGWQPEWDVESVVEGGWNFDDRTLFRGVKKLRPGHYMTCDSTGHIGYQQYWDIEYPDKHHLDDRSEDEIIAGVRERLMEAVRVRLRADVPVGVYLSGGIDSSVIAGLVTHLAKEQGRTLGSLPPSERVNCFCVAFGETSGFDESDIAQRTAEWLGVKMHRQTMDENALASRFEDATYHCEHHNSDLNYIGKFALSELTRDLGFKVVLTGEGADETFTGYGVYLPDVLREADLTWKDSIPEEERIRLFEKSESDTNAYYKSIGAGDITKFIPAGRMKLNGITTVASMTAFMPPVFDDWTACLDLRHPQDVIADDISADVMERIQHKWHPANSAQYVWSKGHLINIMLSCLGDRTEMAHSVEGRTPFLDHHLTEYVNNIPPSLRMKWNGSTTTSGDTQRTQARSQQNEHFTGKWVLREAMRPFVTNELYQRVKHPYTAPLQYEFGGPLHTVLARLITEENVRQLGFVSWEKASTLMERTFAEKDTTAARLAFCVAQWVVLAQRFGIKTAEQRAS